MDINLLYEKACSGDRPAERELFEKLSARFSLFTRRKITDRQDCDEVVQDAITAVLEGYKTVQVEASFAAWARQVLAHKIADYYRAKQRRRRVYSLVPEGIESTGSALPDPDLKRALVDCLRKVNAINRRHARILVLRYQGFRIDEICRRLHLTKTNCYSILSRARAMLQTCLSRGEIRP